MLITYPICWALSEGANVINPTGEMIWYGILDIIAGPLFLFFFLWEIRGVDYHVFGLHSGKYTDHGAHVEKGLPTSQAPSAPAATAAPATQ